jgi:hypothetical protein
MDMQASAFDPKAFLDMQFSEASSTERVNIPAGEHLALVEKVETTKWTKKDDSTKFGLRLDVTYLIDSADVKALLGREKVTVTQGIMLDLTPTGGLDFSKGRNVTLGRLRECVGLNKPGESFGFRMLEGRPLKIVIGHKPSEAPGAQPGDMYDNVVGFVRAM